jgi:hypothetical protein
MKYTWLLAVLIVFGYGNAAMWPHLTELTSLHAAPSMEQAAAHRPFMGQAVQNDRTADSGGSAAFMPIPASTDSEGLPSEPATDLDKQIKTWIVTLSEQSEFKNWTEASFDVYPLGPGSHGWVVLLRNGDKEIGYMVIHAVTDGRFSLSEYGSGPRPLFSMNTLRQSLLQRGLIESEAALERQMANGSVSLERLYKGSLEGFWVVRGVLPLSFFDAKTGDELPDISASLDGLKEAAGAGVGSASENRIVESLLLESFDPMERSVWIGGKPLQIGDPSALADMLRKGSRIVAAVPRFDGKSRYILSVIGFDRWEQGGGYVILDQEGPRRVPYSVLKNAKLYRY